MIPLIVVISIVLFCLLKSTWRRYTLWRWKSRLHLNDHLRALDHISASTNGFQLSRESRIDSDAFEYVYGEIDSSSLVALLSLTQPNPSTVFYDLGSGVGKAVLMCAMTFNVKKACGIELFPLLHQAAQQQLESLNTNPVYYHTAKKIEFICGDFLYIDFSDATVIFISATGLFGDTWIALNQHLEQLPGAPLIITTTKKLLSPKFKLHHTTRVQMSWGVVNAYIQQGIDYETTPGYAGFISCS